MNKHIDIKTFRRHIDVYGSNFHLWQGYDQNELRDFIAENDEALDLYLDAQELDVLLDDYHVPAANPEIIVAAKAQIIRDQQEAKEGIDVIKPARPSFGGLFGLIPRPAYALASVLCVMLVVVFTQQDKILQPEDNKAAFEVAAVDDFVTELEELDRQNVEQEEMMMAFAEVEQEQKIEDLIDNLYMDIGEDIPDDLWEYFNKES